MHNFLFLIKFISLSKVNLLIMTKLDKIQLFEDRKVRTLWDDEQEKWFFSIIDVIEILTDSPRPRKYWNALKTKLETEGSELSQSLGQLKMRA